VNDRDVMLWRKRRTVGWLNLSLAARGAAEGIAVALDERGELRLGKYGLPGLAGPLGRPWAECEPAVLELLEAARLVHDEARGVIYDPQHQERTGQTVVHRDLKPANVVLPEELPAPLSSTERSRASRAKRRSEPVLQLDLPTAAALQRAATPCNVAALHAVDPAPESGVMPVGSIAVAERCITVAPDSPSLSDLKISSKIRERGSGRATSRDVVQRDATIPDDCRAAFAEACAAARVALSVEFVWKKFTPHAHAKRWRVHELAARWDTWVAREIEWSKRAAAALEATPRPGLAEARRPPDTRPIVAERERWEREARAAPRDKVLAGARGALAALGC
jgi:hypothetical protein